MIESLRYLLEILKRKKIGDCPELVLNVIGTINNISFYSFDGNYLLRYRVAISGLYSCDHGDAVTQV